ncbi:MAG: hypothetical protein LKI24_08345 [Acidipropionibacterium sp.]|nr:hypothetical protein [Acidipropionibacterium sp.]
MIAHEGPPAEDWPDDVTAIIHHLDHLEQLIEGDPASRPPASSRPALHRQDLTDLADRLRYLASLLPPGARTTRPEPGPVESITDQIWHHIKAIEQLQRRAQQARDQNRTGPPLTCVTAH